MSKIRNWLLPLGLGALIVVNGYYSFQVYQEEGSSSYKAVHSHDNSEILAYGPSHMNSTHSVAFEFRHYAKSAVLFAPHDITFTRPSSNFRERLHGIAELESLEPVAITNTQAILDAIEDQQPISTGVVGEWPGYSREDDGIHWEIYVQEVPAEEVVVIQPEEKRWVFVDLELLPEGRQSLGVADND